MREYRPEDIKDLKILGRYSEKTVPLTLFWHGSGLEVSLKARELWVEFNTVYEHYEHWISVWIDGALIARQIVPAGKNWIPIFLDADPDVVHHVKIIKEVQPMTEDSVHIFQICGVKTDGVFVPGPVPAMRIEFIGDSITSGEGTVGAKTEMRWNSMIMGASFAYPLMTANRLDAEARMFSKGGWGVYSGYDGDRKNNIPAYYEDIASMFAGRSEEYLGACENNDFSSWQPDVIVVNLGTNDANACSNLPEGKRDLFIAEMKQAVRAFLADLRKNNPDAYIIWAYGSFDETLTLHIKDALEEYAEESGDDRAEAVKFPTLKEETKGSREHPGREWHREVTELLVQKIKNLTNEERG